MGIEFENISFRYSPKSPWILQNFSCSLEENRITAITGPNAIGKTTLGKILMGLLKPSAGHIYIDGENIRKWSMGDRGAKVGYLMQNPADQVFCMSVADEIEFSLKNRVSDRKIIEERRDFFLEYFELEEKKNDSPMSLGLGETQRLVLASLLAVKYRYFFFDEPTASLDLYRRQLLGEYLVRRKEEDGCGIILISHDEKFIDKYADECINFKALMKGRV